MGEVSADSPARAGLRVPSASGPAPAWVGLGVTALVVTAYLGWESLFGHPQELRAAGRSLLELPGAWTAFVLALLAGFLVGGDRWVRSATLRDLHGLRGILDCSPAEHAALVQSVSSPRLGRAWLARLLGAPVGLFVVTAPGVATPFLLSQAEWSHDFVWGLGLNVLLFSEIGRQVHDTLEKARLFQRLASRVADVDLLDLGALAPFAHRGLRSAMFWLGGSTLASLLFVNFDLGTPTALVLLGTVGVGTLALLLPVRGIHGRIHREKQDELRRVRALIRQDRATLDSASEMASARLPGLLAYEARIDDVRAWPLDASVLTRFGLVMLLAVGSWLGGAVVERVLGVWLD